ncbi:class Ib ribonucleoside-diphosphate reductase assembly flavoprotein NrdI [Liquorilactobacillus oeni]|uniref:Ribonucleotide reductase family protein n=1 Tax=Liquorilactobacillus oeni DSM 19972 TaxID=1423777 RepID=A0A0R1MAD4_9LACO|nr:class Ib ribonucleoside-diphosphate reductase assembly flavoprotein NrdI [Liquorilactobacillus oeni]KRL05086.1 ribonucleotide reductase family protein [Liquorilactobacillus oeni DSM 19972]
MATEKCSTKPLQILYTSIEGNTRSFVTKLEAYAKQRHMENPEERLVKLTEISEASGEVEIAEPFAVFVPTYLGGGNGIDNGNNEIMTTELRDTLEDFDNYKNCYGVIGSGNRNFNAQFGLTAKQYAQQFSFPLIDLFELRGTSKDVERIYARLNTYQTRFEKQIK